MKNIFSTIQKKSSLPTKDLIGLTQEKKNFLELRVDEVDSCLDILETYITSNRTPAHSFYYSVVTTFRVRVERIDEIFTSIRYSSPEISKLKLIDLESDIMELRKQINTYLNIFSNGLEKIQ